ncbi:5'-nucleotidase, lipoprotein e(P4) family [Phytopseudomonas dryadis]|uniref:Acid phosphatase n=1 Tax=Phytopseudomonas dryadis TaxID=2487520 RepID=A0A4Q9RA24_9GAMM|nr:HAD family acid phosphatase [Pseudomonas dryadis]TBU97585.1 acid phosphatase [Pseudomonas dryadis]
MRPYGFLASLLLAALTGCQQHPPANDQLDAVLWTQTSIEHELIYRQVFAAATRQLQTALGDPAWDALAQAPRELHGLPPALIVDIDETLLDNTSLNAHAIVADQPYDYGLWNQWVEDARAPALPGALEFIQAAVRLGIKPYYLTNRSHGQEQATLANLQRAGFPIAGSEQILTAGTPTGGCQASGSDKTCRRQWVGSRARVLMLVGDFIEAPNSLAAGRDAAAPYLAWLGQRWFLLPNPTHGGWYSAPYQDREALPLPRKRALKQQALRR